MFTKYLHLNKDVVSRWTYTVSCESLHHPWLGQEQSCKYFTQKVLAHIWDRDCDALCKACILLQRNGRKGLVGHTGERTAEEAEKNQGSCWCQMLPAQQIHPTMTLLLFLEAPQWPNASWVPRLPGYAFIPQDLKEQESRCHSLALWPRHQC